MYVFQHNGQLSIEEFFLPFGGKLDPGNRWILLSTLIPWLLLEGHYAPLFNPTKGAPAKPFRMAFASIYIQQRLGLSDRETVELITESPYLQFFLGLNGFEYSPPFDPSMMVHFRKRIGPDLIKICNEMTKANGIEMIKELLASYMECESTLDNELDKRFEKEMGIRPPCDDPASNWGTIILDATCIPDDIPYPVDVRLLNEARETTEAVIDKLFSQLDGKISRKPRCNRDKARNRFLSFIKKKKLKKAEIREEKRFQLNEVARNLQAIDRMIHCGASLSGLTKHLYKKLLVTSELYRQQQGMYDADSRRIDDRIVNLAKPHVRPIVRGKAGRKTEFGAKISISDDNGFVDLDRISWDNYNEAKDLIKRVELYKQERGYYPERVCADAIYMTAENKRFCQQHGIRLSGRGRSKTAQAPIATAEQKDLFKSDTRKRSVIEGRFGTSKRKYGLDKILTKLISTSKSVIAMTYFVMNTEKIIRLARLLISLLIFLWVAICFLIQNWLKGEILAFI
jgi:IS5 family transposase